MKNELLNSPNTRKRGNKMLFAIQIGDEWEWLLDKKNHKVLASGHKLDAEDVLFALGYRFDIEEVDGDEPIFDY